MNCYDNGMLSSMFIFFSAVLTLSKANELARGWGDGIEWVTFKDGLTKAEEQKKPLMLVIHKSWCGACKALKPKFGASEEIATLSQDFIMVNTEDDEEPEESQFRPDGGYIPRIFFLDSNGKVNTAFKNDNGNASYKYYYPSVEDIIEAMVKVKKAVTDNEFTMHEEL